MKRESNGDLGEAAHLQWAGPAVPFSGAVVGSLGREDPLLGARRDRQRLLRGQHRQRPGATTPGAGGAGSPHRLQR